MPSSLPDFIPTIIKTVMSTNPRSVLDVGIGFGKWGHLFREYLDVYHGRVFKEDWLVNIEGVEIFRPYIEKQPWLSPIYDKIYCADIWDFLVRRSPVSYDIIMAGDVIEHLPKPMAQDVLVELHRISNKSLVLSIPLGKEWLGNKVVAGNGNERHLSAWTKEDVVSLLDHPTIYKESIGSRKVALFIYQK